VTVAIALEIVTPEGPVLERDVDGVTLPTELGEVGILPGHVPLAGIVVPGLLHLSQGGQRESLAVDEGFFILRANVLSVLVEGAIAVAEIDPDEVERAQRRAEEALARARRAQLDAGEIGQLEAKIRYQIVKRRARR
jgi:F-type H+-transporting ATPase subunit epsilon